MHLKFRDENVTSEAVFTCIHHLYSASASLKERWRRSWKVCSRPDPAFHLVNSTNSRAILVTALIFDGMPELAQHAFNVARDSISADSLLDWVTWLGQEDSGYIGQKVPVSSGEDWNEGDGRYGSWTGQLKQEV